MGERIAAWLVCQDCREPARLDSTDALLPCVSCGGLVFRPLGGFSATRPFWQITENDRRFLHSVRIAVG